MWAGVVPATGVYVMRTLREDFHMGSVEWVTFQGPASHWRVGGGICGVGEAVERVEGRRRRGGIVDGLGGGVVVRRAFGWRWDALQ